MLYVGSVHSPTAPLVVVAVLLLLMLVLLMMLMSLVLLVMMILTSSTLFELGLRKMLYISRLRSKINIFRFSS